MIAVLPPIVAKGKPTCSLMPPGALIRSRYLNKTSTTSGMRVLPSSVSSILTVKKLRELSPPPPSPAARSEGAEGVLGRALGPCMMRTLS